MFYDDDSSLTAVVASSVGATEGTNVNPVEERASGANDSGIANGTPNLSRKKRESWGFIMEYFINISIWNQNLEALHAQILNIRVWYEGIMCRKRQDSLQIFRHQTQKWSHSGLSQHMEGG